MNMQISQEEFDELSPGSMVPLKCKVCGEITERTKSLIESSIKTRGRSNDFCSNKCWGAYTSNKSEFKCAECGTSVWKKPSEIAKSKSGRTFCDKSCACSYNNKHKTSGFRRSKMEVFLEEQIKTHFPDIPVIANDKETIGSELDLYFPTLRFAIELNGIFHYEPIYGEDKLERVQANDQQKLIRCAEVGVELCVLDVSHITYLNKKRKEEYWGIVSGILEKIQKRHQ